MQVEPTGAVEVWRGGVNTWECDEMGHMNVRFYVTRAHEALAGVALRLGMPNAFRADATATLAVKSHHVRFLAEAHAGAPLHMTGGVLSVEESAAEVVLMLIHSRDGRPCASFRTRVEHATPDGRAFPWPDRARRAADALKIDAPPEAQPRSIAPGAPFHAHADAARADALDLICINRGVVEPRACDAFGRMHPAEFIGRVSDGVPTLLADLRRLVGDSAPDQPKRVGGAVLEYRLDYLTQPRAGDHLEVRSGLAEVTERFQRMVHWMLDPVTGRPWGVSEAVAINFDLDRRKVIPISDHARTVLQDRIKPGLLAAAG